MRVITRYYRVQFPTQTVRVPHVEVMRARKGQGLTKGRTPYWLIRSLAAAMIEGLDPRDGKIIRAEI